MSQFDIKWMDAYREPQCPPDPDYPNGIDVDQTVPGTQACKTALPYPAKRCGIYYIHCHLCGVRVGVTTAGRPDDPRSVKLPCLPMDGRA